MSSSAPPPLLILRAQTHMEHVRRYVEARAGALQARGARPHLRPARAPRLKVFGKVFKQVFVFQKVSEKFSKFFQSFKKFSNKFRKTPKLSNPWHVHIAMVASRTACLPASVALLSCKWTMTRDAKALLAQAEARPSPIWLPMRLSRA